MLPSIIIKLIRKKNYRFKGDFLKKLTPFGTIWNLEQESGMFLSCSVFFTTFFFELNSNNLQRVMNSNHSFEEIFEVVRDVINDLRTRQEHALRIRITNF